MGEWGGGGKMECWKKNFMKNNIYHPKRQTDNQILEGGGLETRLGIRGRKGRQIKV